MSNLAANLFLRELARRDVEKERTKREQSNIAEAQSQAFDRTEKMREAAFNRQLKTAEAMSKYAAAAGKPAPQFEMPAVQEAGTIGRMAGEEELTSMERAAAAKALDRLQQKQRDEYLQSQEMLRRQQQEKSAMERASLEESGRMQRAQLGESEAWKRAQLEDRRLRTLAAARSEVDKDVARLGGGARAKQQNEVVAQDSMLKNLREIKSSASIEGAEQAGKRVIDYESLLGPKAKSKMMDYERAVAVGGAGNLTAEERKDYQKRKNFIAKIDLVKSVKMHELIGAGQTVSEAERLVNALISYDMNPQEFAAALEAMEDESFIKKSVSQEALGIAPEERPEEFTIAEPSVSERYAPGAIGSFYSKFQRAIKEAPVVGKSLYELIPRR